MLVHEASIGVDPGLLLRASIDGFGPFLPCLALLLVLLVAVRLPLIGRGPGFQRRDPWRGFRFGARRHVLRLAGGRCEGPLVLAWGRCHRSAEEVDHIYPWSKGGATIVSNGQALCHHHNSQKANHSPAWWYVLSLERRRQTYYPAEASVRVSAAMSTVDRAARARWSARRSAAH